MIMSRYDYSGNYFPDSIYKNLSCAIWIQKSIYWKYKNGWKIFSFSLLIRPTLHKIIHKNFYVVTLYLSIIKGIKTILLLWKNTQNNSFIAYIWVKYAKMNIHFSIDLPQIIWLGKKSEVCSVHKNLCILKQF